MKYWGFPSLLLPSHSRYSNYSGLRFSVSHLSELQLQRDQHECSRHTRIRQPVPCGRRREEFSRR